jgi:hypothetical protein
MVWEKWTQVSGTTLSSEKPTVTSWDVSGDYISSYLPLYSSTRKDTENESLLKTCLASNKNALTSKEAFHKEMIPLVQWKY